MRVEGREQPFATAPERYLRWGVDCLLLGLVVFTPLAFGSVQFWGIGIIEGAALLAGLLWILHGISSGEREGQPESGWSWIVGPLRRSQLGLAVAAFATVILLQLVPLPPSLLRLVSPAAHALYNQNLPYYGTPHGVDLNRIESWLLKEREKEELTTEEPPWGDETHPDLKFGNWRCISLVPASTRRALGLWLSYLLLFLLTVDRCRDSVFRRRLLWTIASTGALVAMLGVAQETTWGDRIYGRIRPAYGGSPMGPFVNRNHFAGYLEMALAVFAGLWLSVLRRERDEGPIPRATRPGLRDSSSYVPQLFMLSLFLAVAALALLRSGSRGGLVASGCTFVLFGFLIVRRATPLPRWWRWALVSGILVVGAALAWKVNMLTQQESFNLGLASEPSFAMRLRIWGSSIGMLGQFLGFGTGLGTYGFVVPLYQPGGYDHLWIYAHNDYVQLACETGLAGLSAFIVGAIAFFRSAFLQVLRSPLERGGAALGCAAGMASLLIHSMVDFNLQIPSNGLLFVLLGAVLISSSPAGARIVGQQRSEEAVHPGRLLPVVVSAAVWLAGTGTVALAVAERGWQSSATAKFWGGSLVEARDDLDRALRFNEAVPDLQADRGFYYLRVLDDWEGAGKALGMSPREALSRARQSFAWAINLNPANTNHWAGLAEVYRQASAVQLRSRVVDLSALTQAPAGMSRLEKLRLAVMRRMIAVEPRNPFHHARLGDLFMEQGRSAEALVEYEEAMRLLPKVSEHPFLGSQDVPAEVLQAAIRGARKALAEGSRELPVHQVHLNLAELYERLADWTSAVQEMEKACELLPKFGYYHLKLGVLLFEKGDLERSREHVLKSIELGPRDAWPFLVLARVARKAGNSQEAEDSYRKALSIDSDNGRAALELAQLYDSTKQDPKAERQYLKALALLPDDPLVLLSVADYYDRRGLSARSIRLMEKVVSLRPEEPVYKSRLEQMRERARLSQ